MANIWLDTTVLSNHKIKKLIRLGGHEAFTCLLRLWIFTAEHRSSGKLTGLDSDDITDVAEWNSETCGFADLLVKCKLLDKKHDIYFVHDFIENNPYIAKAKARSESAKKAAQARWGEQSDSNADALQPQSSGMTGVLPKKRKEKKRNNTKTPPAEVCEEIINYLNEKANRKFDITNEEHHKFIRTRWKKYPDVSKFKFVIDVCCHKWKGNEEMKDFLQPSTLFNGKFAEKLGWTLPAPDSHLTREQIQQQMADEKKRA